MRTGVLGGTFDPVHIGHLLLGETARDELGLERVLFVPAAFPWRKAGREITPARHRLRMLQLAIEGSPAFELCDIEIEKGGPTYTVETLGELRERHPDRELFLILGEDSWRDLPNWREPERILELASPVIAGRPEAEGGEGPRGGAERATWLHMPRIEVSATDIRSRVAGSRSIRYLVPDAVEQYVRENGLYSGPSTGQRLWKHPYSPS